jgi:hypothetical protein
MSAGLLTMLGWLAIAGFVTAFVASLRRRPARRSAGVPTPGRALECVRATTTGSGSVNLTYRKRAVLGAGGAPPCSCRCRHRTGR